MIKKVSIIVVVLGLCTVVMANNLEEMPIAAKAGQCFTKAFYPPPYTKVTKVKSTKRVLLNEESVKLLPSVAVYKLDLNGKKQFVETEDVISQKLFVWSKFLL